ncbi:hypothetical protein GCM10009599_01610 [Luteococcus peritonei]
MGVAYRMFHTRLVRRERLSASFVRLTLAGPDLADCSPTLLDQRVKLVFGAAEQLGALAAAEDWYVDWQKLGTDAPALRTYTLSAVRPAEDGSGEVDLDVVVHETDGSPAPGTQFARDAALGTVVGLVAGDRTQEGHDSIGVAWKGHTAREVLLIGDETALPAVANIVRTLPAGCRGCVLLEVPHESDIRLLEAPSGVRTEWYVRSRGERLAREQAAAHASRPSVAPDELVWEEPVEADAGERFAWVAGEAGWVKQLRPVVSELGFRREQQSIMGYWKQATG